MKMDIVKESAGRWPGSEGAAVLVLESEKTASARGAVSLALVALARDPLGCPLVDCAMVVVHVPGQPLPTVAPPLVGGYHCSRLVLTA